MSRKFMLDYRQCWIFSIRYRWISLDLLHLIDTIYVKSSFQIVTHQQRIFMILNSLRIPYTAVDIAAPGHEDETDFMRANAKKKDGQRHVLPPQIFNGEKYCGV